MGEARRRAEARHSDDIDTTGVLIDGWQARPGLAVTEAEAARPPIWINPERIAHVTALHPHGGKGKVTLMRRVLTKEAGWRWKSLAVEVGELAACPDLQHATHVSMNRFYGLRRASGLRQVQAVFADIDRLAEAMVPAPSYWLSSGRGLLGVWLLDALPAGAAPRMKALQRALLGPKIADDGTVTVAGRKRTLSEKETRHALRMAGIWQGTGLDRSASDVSRVFRISGSRNEKSGRRVRLLWPASWDQVRRYDVDELAEAVLPYTREELAALRAERQAQYQATAWAREDRADRAADAACAEGQPMPGRRSPRTRFAAGPRTGQWERRVEALQQVREWWGGTVPAGLRDLWAFHMACAWACLERGDLSSWARDLAPLCGLPERELRVSLGTVHGKMLAFQRGELTERDGEPRDPRYTPSHGKVLEDLDLSAEDAEAAGVGYMLKAGSALTATQRSADRRLREGATARTATVEQRHADGLAAHAMRAAGKGMKEIAAALGRGLTSLTRAMAETVDRVGQVVEAAAEVVADAVQPRPVLAAAGIHGSARYLVAEPSSLAKALSGRSAIRLPTLSRKSVPTMPTPDAPPIPPARRFVPVVRPRILPVSWAPRTQAVLPAAEPVRSSPAASSTPSRLSALRPALAFQEPEEAPAPVSSSAVPQVSPEPVEAPGGSGLVAMLLRAFPGAVVVAERPSKQAA